jgi:hypothetical protein
MNVLPQHMSCYDALMQGGMHNSHTGLTTAQLH